MKERIRVFCDSDVVISSFLSRKGAAFYVATISNIERIISRMSSLEIQTVGKRLNLPGDPLLEHLKGFFLEIPLTSKKTILYRDFVLDTNDAHIVAGAVEGNASFLLTYNLKDFHKDKIGSELGIVCLSPGDFLQYLRAIL